MEGPQRLQSTHIVQVSDDLLASLERDREALPAVYERFRRLNADEPYRMKCAYMYERVLNALAVARTDDPATGPVYHNTAELVDDLTLMSDSMRANRGGNIAAGRLGRLRRAAKAFGLTLAALDIREDSSVTGAAIGELMDLTRSHGCRRVLLMFVSRSQRQGFGHDSHSCLCCRRNSTGSPEKGSGAGAC